MGRNLSHQLAKFGGHKNCEKWRYNDLRWPSDLTRPHDWRVMLLYGQEPITIIYCPGKFGGHRNWGSEDKMI